MPASTRERHHVGTVSIGRPANRHAEACARHRGKRILLSLPAELRKDIDPPEIFETRESRRAATFSAKAI